MKETDIIWQEEKEDELAALRIMCMNTQKGAKRNLLQQSLTAITTDINNNKKSRKKRE